MMPVLVLVHVDNASEIASIDAKIMSIEGVVDVRSYAHPLSYTIEPKTMFRQSVADKIREGLYVDGRSLHIVTIAYNPYTKDAFNVVKAIRSELSGYERYVTGVAAMYYDISVLVNEDFSRLAKIVIAAILIFLTIVFGSFLIPLRLEGTVLLNIGGTLGVVYLILKLFNEPLGRIIPITLFVVLNGLGMDYDIFLVTRIMEERSKGLSDDEAIVEAVANTMRVITACGIIMSSSFGMLLLTGMPIVMQVGLGLALAVLFDTFIMRAFFVPAFMSLAGKRNRRAPKAMKKLAVYKVE
jgi:RND superfamily putative drug exporter